MRKIITKKLKSIDILGSPVSLLFKGRTYYSTVKGSLLTMTLLSLLILISFGKLYSVIFRINIIINSNDMVNSSPLKVNLKGKFALSMTPTILTSLENKRYLDFSFTIGTHRIINGSLIKERKVINAVTCNQTHFPDFNEKELNDFGFKNWICPDFGNYTEVNVVGKYLDPVYQFLQIGIRKCNNQNNRKNDSFCSSDDEIETIKKNNGKLYVSLIMVNHYINLNDYDKPFSEFIETSDFLIDTSNKFVQRELYFTPIKLSTDDTKSLNVLRNEDNNEIKETFIYERKYDEFSTNENLTIYEDRQYASIYLRSDKMSKKYLRKYETIQDFLQTLGSIYSVLFVVFKFLNDYWTSYDIIEKIAKTLYRFNEIKIYRPPNIIKSTINKLSLGFFFNTKVKDIYFQDVDIKIKNDLNLIHILSNLKQADLLKSIILSQNQIKLLNLTSKPQFNKFSSYSSKKRISQAVDKNSKKNKINAKKQKLKSKMNPDDFSNLLINEICVAIGLILKSEEETDKRLIDLLDKELAEKVLRRGGREDLIRIFKIKKLKAIGKNIFEIIQAVK